MCTPGSSLAKATMMFLAVYWLGFTKGVTLIIVAFMVLKIDWKG
jgi:hypothetical protein